MDLIKAVRSGKPIKRKDAECYILITETMGSCYYFPYQDILADDWEIQEEKIEITSSQLANAYYLAAIKSSQAGPYPFLSVLSKELGFKND